MKYITGTDEIRIEEPTVVTIGKFDGRHRGHQKLLRKMQQLKEQHGYKTAVFTFDMMPASLVTKTAQKIITTNQERRNNMEKMGIDYLVEYPFNESVSHMAPEEFIRKLLVEQMNAKAIVAGTDCGFGYKRAGDAQLLLEMAPVYHYEAIIIEKEQDRLRDISSTYIKEELGRGNIEKANELLGEPYAIHGYVVHGRQIGGSMLGFPTANILPPQEKFLPAYGVYVSLAYVNDRYYGGVTNIGEKPTVEGENPVGAETFLFGLDEDIYGKMLEIQLLHFLRPEMKFASLSELGEQIACDKQLASSYLKNRFIQHCNLYDPAKGNGNEGRDCGKTNSVNQ